MHTHSPPSTGVDSFSAVSRAGALLSRTFLLQVLSLHLIGAHPMAAKIPPPPFIHSSSSRAARLKAKIPPPAFIHSSSSFPSFIPYFQYPNHTLYMDPFSPAHSSPSRELLRSLFLFPSVKAPLAPPYNRRREIRKEASRPVVAVTTNSGGSASGVLV